MRSHRQTAGARLNLFGNVKGDDGYHFNSENDVGLYDPSAKHQHTKIDNTLYPS
jgi:hypothetical protein